MAELATEILCAVTTHKPILDARMKIDFIFAYASTDEVGTKLGDAIRHHSCRALGLCRRLGLKDRVMGRGDCEILLDADWWETASGEQARALLDHELTHIEVMTDKHGRILWDDIKRPKLRLRPHDFEFGWFISVAERHRAAAQECIQARTMLDAAGQWLWPDLVAPPAEEPTVEIRTGGKTSGPMSLKKFSEAAKGITMTKKIYHLKR